MHWLEMVRLAAAALTIVAAIMVAANWSPRMMVAGFAVFVAASLAWMLDGYADNKPSLLIQNAVLLVVNIAGIYRWLPRAKTQ